MSKFESEAAKRGEKVQVFNNGIWHEAHFVGTSENGLAACFEVFAKTGRYTKWHNLLAPEIRMKPKHREMWIFPYSSDGVIFTSTPCETREEAEIVKLNFPKPAGKVQMILVEE